MSKPRRLFDAMPLRAWLAIAAVIGVLFPLSSAFAQGNQYTGSVVHTFTNCAITQIIGTVSDASGNPKTGVRIRVSSGADYVSYTTSGSYVRPETNASGWDMFLNTGNVANTWQVAVVDNNNAPLSGTVNVNTAGSCNAGDANVVKVEFREGAAPPPPPQATTAPSPSDPGVATEPAPPIQAGATCQTFSQTGYQVCNDGNGQFLRVFNDYGLQTIGYPVSSRFKRDGFITQAFQKAILQWRPDGNTAAFVNTFDELHNRGYDQQLLAWRQTPTQLDQVAIETGMSFSEIVARRQAWLNDRPAIRSAYFSVPDPILTFGLPTSQIQDMGNHYAIRLQRAVIQQWKENVPWASAGEVTIANGGDIAKELGHLPNFALNQNVTPPPPASSPVPPPNPAPPATGEPARNLDPRLGALGVTITPANVASGQAYWRAVQVLWHDEAQSEGRHSTLVDVLDSNENQVVGVPVRFRWGSGEDIIPTESKPFPEYGISYAMWHAGCSYFAAVADGTPSDEVNCLGLGSIEQRDWNIHVEYLIKFQKVVKP